MTDMEKLRILLPHWIAHNHEHIAEIDRWASLCEISDNIHVKEALKKAIGATEKVNEELQHAMDMAPEVLLRTLKPMAVSRDTGTYIKSTNKL
jgi:hypothetical protein